MHTENKKSPRKKLLWRVLRIAAIGAIIAYIATRTDAASFAAALAALDLRAAAAALGLLTVSMALPAVKWWLLIRRFAPNARFRDALSAHLEGTFYSMILPGAAAQDALKSAILAKTLDPPTVWAAAWVARLTGFAPLLALSVVGVMLLEGSLLPQGTRFSIVAASAAVAVLCALSFSKRLTRPIRLAATALAGEKAVGKIARLRDGIYVFGRAPKTLALAVGVSAVLQAAVVVVCSLAAYAVSGKFFLAECLAFVPISEVAAFALPVTPGGAGIREGLMAVMFEHAGMSGDQIALFAALSIAVNTIAKVIGIVPALLLKSRFI